MIIHFKKGGIPNALKEAVCKTSGLRNDEPKFFTKLQKKLSDWDDADFYPDVQLLERWWGKRDVKNVKNSVPISDTNLDNICLYASNKTWLEFKKHLKDNETNLWIKSKKQTIHSQTSKLIADTYDDFNNINWKLLLQEAEYISISIYYFGSKFIIQNDDIKEAFIRFFRNDGALTLYLPNLLGIYNKFSFETLNEGTINDIVKTKNSFIEWHKESLINKDHKGKISFYFLDTGFNYMFADIIYKNKSNFFLFSPYQNNHEKNNSPVMLLNKANIKNAHIDNFFKAEKTKIESEIIAERGIQLLDNKFITWDEEQDRVFISLALSCSGGCVFCYIDQIVDKSHEPNREKGDFSKSIAKQIINDPRFNFGPKGTAILFGAFTDPFLNDRHIAWTIEIIELIGKFGNFFHIASRLLLFSSIEDWIERIQPNKFNVIVNYSISHLKTDEDDHIEFAKINNGIDERFIESKNLIDAGLLTALYIRPVLPGLTLNDTDKIIEFAKNSGLSVVTIGGLYTNDKIKERLKKNKIKTDHLKVMTNRHLILDTKKQLLKMDNSTEVDQVRASFLRAGFNVFNSSMEVIDYYRGKFKIPRK